MATWAEQGGRDEVDPIPPCPYLVRRGQEPDYMGRSNIQVYTDALANQPSRWRQLTDSEGRFVEVLPPLGTNFVGVTQPVSPMQAEKDLAARQVAQAQNDMREIQVYSVFDTLEDQDFKPNGLPRVDVVRNRTGLELTGSEIKTMWITYQENKK